MWELIPICYFFVFRFESHTLRHMSFSHASKSSLDIAKNLNAEGIHTVNGKKWLKTTVHTMMDNEAYTGAVVWGTSAKDRQPPVRVEDAHPAIISKREYRRVKKLLGSRAPKQANPGRASSPYLLSGILKCETCGRAMSAYKAKSGKYTHYVCQSLMKRGSGTCKPPRLNAKNFENLIVDELRANILTQSRAFIRSFVKEVAVRPRKAAILYTLPTPKDNRIGGDVA